MKAKDVTQVVELALTASGCDQAQFVHKPRLVTVNGLKGRAWRSQPPF